MWEEAVSVRSEFSAPQRLLRVALKYRKSHKVEEARTLVAEERELFEKLIADAKPMRLNATIVR
jgi:hypothetical protein